MVETDHLYTCLYARCKLSSMLALSQNLHSNHCISR